MAKYQQYEEYKNSGIEWLGKIPKDWKLKRIQESTSIINGYPFESSKFNPTKGMPLVRIRDIRHQKTEVCFDGVVPEAAVINNGDILIGMDGDFNVAKWTGGMAALNQRVACIRHENPIIQSFLYYLLPYHMKIVNDLTYYTTVKHLSSNDILKTTFALPSENELKNIVSFLNHETAQIDTLIEKQQTLIQLLKEKRQAVISHAVTKGLNSDAPMKDSGVEWLGEVPEHWNVQRFKFLCDQIISGPFGSSITKDMYIKYGYKVYGQEQVIANDFEVGDYFISAKDFEALSRYKVKKGSILISCVGTFGKIAVFPFDAAEGIINPRLIQAELDSENNPFFIRELLKSEAVYKQFELLSRGGTMGVINISILNEIIIATPNKSEQTEIYEYLVKQQNSFNGLIEKAEQAIQLMQERRTALISAAVTGKIDVRGWQAPESKIIMESL